MERHGSAGTKRDQMMWGGSEGLEMYSGKFEHVERKVRHETIRLGGGLACWLLFLATEAWLTGELD